MVGHLRVKSPLSQLGIFLGLLGGAFFVASLIMVLFMLIMGFPISGLEKPDFSNPKMLPAMKFLQACSSLLVFLVPALVFSLIVFRGKHLYFLGVKPVTRGRMYSLAVLMILASFPFVFWLGELNQSLPLPEWMGVLEEDATRHLQAFLKAESALDVFINVVVIALLPAVCEELCFRGALQRIMIHLCRNPWLGIVLTSVLFSALHLQFLGFLPRMFLGILLGALYWYSGSIWPAIAAHFVNNAVQVVAVSIAPEFAEENPAVPLAAALGSGLAVAVLLWVYRSLSTVSYERVYEPDALNRSNQFIA